MPTDGQYPNQGRLLRRQRKTGRSRLRVIETTSTAANYGPDSPTANRILLSYFWTSNDGPFVARAPRRATPSRRRVIHRWEIVAAPAATPGAVDLAGTAATASNATGSLTCTRPLAGKAGTASSAKGSLSVFRPMAGSAATASHAKGSLSRRVEFTAKSADAWNGTGSITVTEGTGVARELAGTAASAFSATGQLTRSVPYAGRAGSVFNAKGSTLTTGTVTAVRRVVGVGRRRWAQRSHGVRRP